MHYTLALLSALYCLTSAARNPSWPLQHFKTTNFSTTSISWEKSGAPTSPGYLFIEPSSAGQKGLTAPTIMTDEGELIWRLPSNGGAPNFGPQDVNGETYLVYWHGDGVAGYGAGYGGIYFLDQSYEQVYKVCQADLNIVRIPDIKKTQPCKLDLHESRTTSRGSVLATVRNLTQADLTGVGGLDNAWVLDSVFVEIDIPTDKLLFRWSAVEHMDQLNTFKTSTGEPSGNHDGATIDKAWDFFHMNSVAEVPEPLGGYITSNRLSDAAIKLDQEGNVEWYIQGYNEGFGRGGNFTMSKDAHFAYQHDINTLNVEENSLSITMFDDENRGQKTNVQSSGLQLHLDLSDFTASVERRLLPANHTSSPHTGGYRTLPNGHALVDFGTPPMICEYDENNNLIYTATVASPDHGDNYRAYRKPWVGKPKTKPDVVSHYNATSDETTVYVSWNGATDISQWAMSSSKTQQNLKQAHTADKTGFETTMVVKGLQPFVQVAAMDTSGGSMGQSLMVSTVNTDGSPISANETASSRPNASSRSSMITSTPLLAASLLLAYSLI